VGTRPPQDDHAPRLTTLRQPLRWLAHRPMLRPRLLAAVLAVLVLTGALTVAENVLPEPGHPSSIAQANVSTTTTEAPDFAALVESGVVTALPEAEVELTEEALAKATTTTTAPSTTTTAPADTSTTEAPKPSRSAAPPASTSTTSAPQPPPPTVKGGFSSDAESAFRSDINSYRASQGLSKLARDGSLDSYARSWAKRMAEKGGISHSNISSLLSPWTSVGENVGVGGSVGSIFDALVASSGHRANMLGGFTHLGVGVWKDSSGVLWTAHVFAG
jgi:uncharacterized protein YkwD